MTDDINRHKQLIDSLSRTDCYPHSVESLDIVETHISTVILTGRYAYKIKKPVDFGFLDFTTLQLRKHYCEEELRLNRRLAPELYLDVAPITGTHENPMIQGQGQIIEYAVKMLQFPQHALLDHLLDLGKFTTDMVDTVASRIAEFHLNAAVADEKQSFGTPDAVFAPMHQNFEQVRPLLKDQQQLEKLEKMENWTKDQSEVKQLALAQRKQQGLIRECHGDMHLGNIAWFNNRPCIFDGIEFNDNFRWIDVMSEIAFILMDMDDRHANTLSQRLLNQYLEYTGDYAGLGLLRFYQVYRAMVRAKIACLRLTQNGLNQAEEQQIIQRYQHYFFLAESYTQISNSALMITCGLSGSGKTTVSKTLVETVGAVCIRSDVERKRIFSSLDQSHNGSALNEGIYTPEATLQTYDRLVELSQTLLTSGFTVIIDATFLQQPMRAKFMELAKNKQIPFLILKIEANEQQLKRRIKERAAEQIGFSDADANVLAHQMKTQDPLTREECKYAIEIYPSQIPLQDIKSRLGVTSNDT